MPVMSSQHSKMTHVLSLHSLIDAGRIQPTGVPPLSAIAHVAVHEHVVQGRLRAKQIDTLPDELKELHIALRTVDAVGASTFKGYVPYTDLFRRVVGGWVVEFYNTRTCDIVVSHYFLNESIDCFLAYIARQDQLIGRKVRVTSGHGGVSVEAAFEVCFILKSPIGLRNLQAMYGPFTRYMTENYVQMAFNSGDLTMIQYALDGMTETPILANRTAPFSWLNGARGVCHDNLNTITDDPSRVHVAKWIIETYGLPARPRSKRICEKLLWYMFQTQFPTQIEWVKTHLWWLYASLDDFVDDTRWAEIWRWLLTAAAKIDPPAEDGRRRVGGPAVFGIDRRLTFCVPMNDGEVETYNLLDRACEKAYLTGEAGVMYPHRCGAVCRTLDMILRCTREYAVAGPAGLAQAGERGVGSIDIPINYILARAVGLIRETMLGYLYLAIRVTDQILYPPIEELCANRAGTSPIICVHVLELLYGYGLRLPSTMLARYNRVRPQDIPRMVELGMIPTPANLVDRVLSMCYEQNSEVVMVLDELRRKGLMPSREFINAVDKRLVRYVTVKRLLLNAFRVQTEMTGLSSADPSRTQ